MATITQVDANRANATKSTGPKSESGKAVSKSNAIRHGLRSNQLILPGEDPVEFDALCGELTETLRPVGSAETAIVDRIAITIWRQRRLVKAESAELALNRQDAKVAYKLSGLQTSSIGNCVPEESLRPFDEEHRRWCQAVIDEVEALEEIDFDSLGKNAPHVMAQLESDASEDEEAPEEYTNSMTNGLSGYVSDLYGWCQKQILEAQNRPQLIALANFVRDCGLVLPAGQLEVFARYQTTLDNQMIKLLRAVRDAQEWRLSTLEATATTSVASSATCGD